MWSPRNFLFFLLIPLLNGCGFTPVYATRNDDSAPALATVSIESARGRLGELLKAELQDHFNPEARPVDKTYKLQTGLEMSTLPVANEFDGTVSRYNIILSSPYTLVRLSDGQQISTGTVRGISSYNVSEDADYATFVSEQDAIERGVVELAEDYRMRVSALLLAGAPR